MSSKFSRLSNDELSKCLKGLPILERLSYKTRHIMRAINYILNLHLNKLNRVKLVKIDKEASGVLQVVMLVYHRIKLQLLFSTFFF